MPHKNVTTPIVPKLASSSSNDIASQWIGKVVFAIGHGFHPDTPPSEYVRFGSAEPSFDPVTAEALAADLDTAFAVLGDRIYEDSCWYAWRLQHGLTPEPADDLRSRLLLTLELIDPNGEYADRDAFRNGRAPMTLVNAKSALVRFLSE
jgi:hypothetical protein